MRIFNKIAIIISVIALATIMLVGCATSNDADTNENNTIAGKIIEQATELKNEQAKAEAEVVESMELDPQLLEGQADENVELGDIISTDVVAFGMDTGQYDNKIIKLSGQSWTIAGSHYINQKREKDEDLGVQSTGPESYGIKYVIVGEDAQYPDDGSTVELTGQVRIVSETYGMRVLATDAEHIDWTAEMP